jgi:hypothetical protein
MKGRRHAEEQIITILKQGEGRTEHGGVMSPARNHGADLLPLEGEVRWDGEWSGQAVAAAGRREPKVEACGGRADAG